MALLIKKRLEKCVLDRKKAIFAFFFICGFLALMPTIGAPAFEVKQQDLTSSNLDKTEKSTSGDNLKNKKRKVKILVDLDVVTVALWDKDDRGNIGRKFLERIEKYEFFVISSVHFLSLIEKWGNNYLAKKIETFYFNHTNRFISEIEILENLEYFNISKRVLVQRFKENDVKDEDITLILITSLFYVDYLITFNRKHLKNKINAINEILKSFNLNKIEVRLPNEI